MPTVHRAQIFSIDGAPTCEEARHHLIHHPDGALVVGDDGMIDWIGDFRNLPDEYQADGVEDHRPGFVLPGFIDCHVHFPQTYAIDSYGGGQLLEWLERCIFPSESRLADPEFGRQAAVEFNNRRIAAGTTTALVFGSAFPAAQDALFEDSIRRGLRIISGRGIQTVGPPSAGPLLTTEDAAIDLAAAEIEKWHNTDTGDPATALAQVAVVPRFSLSVTRATLAALGELYDSVRGRGVYFHTHLNENNRPGTGEVDSVKAAYQVDTYLDTYDGRFLPGSAVGGPSMLGRRSVMAHAVHCQDAELARMRATETSIAHCPTSQLFLGSGTMPWRRTIASGVTVGLGTDFAGGDE
ncbi:MAG: amidohydrolase family protein, partial [Candidatus Nanopelagicales bacterium]|nr:amidohydrolase family protein [Candidatus Nanopelagicales bacterium]